MTPPVSSARPARSVTQRDLIARGLRYAHQKPWLLSPLRLMRDSVVLGPFRPVALSCLRRLAPRVQVRASPPTMFTDLDVSQCLAQLRRSGFALGLQLDAEVTADILAFASSRSVHELGRDVHERSEAVRCIAHDPKIVGVLREYLGGGPILHGSSIRPPARGPQEVARAPEYRFHYDVADIASLSVFFYLNDVDLDSGPHVIVEGSHGRKGLADLIHPVMDDVTASSRFGRRIKPILGRRGEGFIEDLTCFHKRLPESRPRWLLVLEYTLVRRPLRRSAGR